MGLCPSSPPSPEPEGRLCVGCFGFSHKQLCPCAEALCWERLLHLGYQSCLVQSWGLPAPWCCVPLAVPPSQGEMHNIGVSLVSPDTQACQCSVCAWLELWAGLSWP